MGSKKNYVFWHVEWSVRITYCHCRRPNTKKQLLWLCISAVCNMLCSVHVCVFVSCVWWALKMVCDMWKARGHNAESYCLRLILDSLVFFLSCDKTHSHTFSHLYLIVWFHFLPSLIWFGPQMWRRKRKKGEREWWGSGWVSVSLSVESLSAF